PGGMLFASGLTAHRIFTLVTQISCLPETIAQHLLAGVLTPGQQIFSELRLCEHATSTDFQELRGAHSVSRVRLTRRNCHGEWTQLERGGRSPRVNSPEALLR